MNCSDGEVSYSEFQQFVEYYLAQQMARGGGGGASAADIAQAIRTMILSG